MGGRETEGDREFGKKGLSHRDGWKERKKNKLQQQVTT
jgi:hypothetical protein